MPRHPAPHPHPSSRATPTPVIPQGFCAGYGCNVFIPRTTTLRGDEERHPGQRKSTRRACSVVGPLTSDVHESAVRMLVCPDFSDLSRIARASAPHRRS